MRFARWLHSSTFSPYGTLHIRTTKYAISVQLIHDLEVLPPLMRSADTLLMIMRIFWLYAILRKRLNYFLSNFSILGHKSTLNWSYKLHTTISRSSTSLFFSPNLDDMYPSSSTVVIHSEYFPRQVLFHVPDILYDCVCAQIVQCVINMPAWK